MNRCVQLEHDLRSAGFAVIIGKNDDDGSLCGCGADDPRDGFYGFSNRTPSVSVNGRCGLRKQSFNVVPVLLDKVPQSLLFFDFLRKA